MILFVRVGGADDGAVLWLVIVVEGLRTGVDTMELAATLIELLVIPGNAVLVLEWIVERLFKGMVEALYRLTRLIDAEADADVCSLASLFASLSRLRFCASSFRSCCCFSAAARS
jgi:hypothetical protein